MWRLKKYVLLSYHLSWMNRRRFCLQKGGSLIFTRCWCECIGRCAFCAANEFSDGSSACRRCPGSTAPDTRLVYKWWNNLPDDAGISSTCMSETGQFSLSALLERAMLTRRLFVLRPRCCSSAATSRRHCFSHRTLHRSVQLCDRL